MTTLHIAQHIPGNTARLFKFRANQLGNRFNGVVIPLDNPSAGGRLRLDVTVSNPEFFQSLEAALAAGETTFQVRDDTGQESTVTGNRALGADIFQATSGQTLVVTSSGEDGVATVAVVWAVAVVAVAAIFTMGGVAVALLNATGWGGGI